MAPHHPQHQRLQKTRIPDTSQDYRAYHGSAHDNLGPIANVESIEDKLRDPGAFWAAKAIWTGDPHIRDILSHTPTGFPHWHDGTGGPQLEHETPMSAAFHLTSATDPEEISWSNSTDHREGDLLKITLLSQENPKSRGKDYWAAMLAQLAQDQWTLAYSDGSGKSSQVAAGAYFGAINEQGAFIGDLASVADGERKGIILAINQAPTNRKLCVLTDSTAALHTAIQLSRGEPPRSGV